MEFLQAFLCVFGGFSVISLFDMNKDFKLDIEKVLFISGENNILKMINKLDKSLILVVDRDVRLLDLPINFILQEGNFSKPEKDLLNVYNSFIDYDYDFGFNITDNNDMVVSSIWLKTNEEGNLIATFHRFSSTPRYSINLSDFTDVKMNKSVFENHYIYHMGLIKTIEEQYFKEESIRNIKGE